MLSNYVMFSFYQHKMCQLLNRVCEGTSHCVGRGRHLVRSVLCCLCLLCGLPAHIVFGLKGLLVQKEECDVAFVSMTVHPQFASL